MSNYMMLIYILASTWYLNTHGVKELTLSINPIKSLITISCETMTKARANNLARWVHYQMTINYVVC